VDGTVSLVEYATAREPRIAIFDCETTGIDPAVDQVIELCVQYGLADGNTPPRATTWRIRPCVPIDPRAQEVHGISAADLAACPAFIEIADAISAAFAEVDVVIGYNVAFDIAMLQAEYTRIGRPPPDFGSKQIVDALRLWQHCEPRSLQHAHRRFVGDGFEAAHSARADVAATARVLSGMLAHFQLAELDWADLALVAKPKPPSPSK
jgi:DNA polymerase-3 subunit epsilon